VTAPTARPSRLVLLHLGLGTVLLLGSDRRTDSPAYGVLRAAGRHVTAAGPFNALGLLALLAAGLLYAGDRAVDRRLVMVGLLTGLAVAASVTTGFAVAAVEHGGAGVIGVVLWAWLTAVHVTAVITRLGWRGPTPLCQPAVLHLALGVALAWGSTMRLEQPSYRLLRDVGATLDPGRPGLPWGVLLAATGLALLASPYRPRHVVAGSAGVLAMVWIAGTVVASVPLDSHAALIPAVADTVVALLLWDRLADAPATPTREATFGAGRPA
jgi:hypothetical protein